MSNFFSKNKNTIGLDISDETMKLVQLSDRVETGRVQAIADVKLPKGTITNNVIQNQDILIEAIKSGVNAPQFGQVTTKQVVASIPETKGFVRVIQLPDMSEAEIEQAIPFEAENYIPLTIDQVYLDWLILGREQGKTQVLITASPRDYINSMVEILKSAGLEPAGLELESQAITRSLIADSDEATLILDINSIRTGMIIYDKGALRFTSSLPIAGNVFTEKIAQSFTIDFEEAEKLKREVGLDRVKDKGSIKTALKPVIKNFVDEVRNTIRFYEDHSQGKAKIPRVLLAGGSARLKHLPSLLQEELTEKSEDGAHSIKSLADLRVELGNPWVNLLKKGESPAISRMDSLGYATAIGLALWSKKD